MRGQVVKFLTIDDKGHDSCVQFWNGGKTFFCNYVLVSPCTFFGYGNTVRIKVKTHKKRAINAKDFRILWVFFFFSMALLMQRIIFDGPKCSLRKDNCIENNFEKHLLIGNWLAPNCLLNNIKIFYWGT